MITKCNIVLFIYYKCQYIYYLLFIILFTNSLLCTLFFNNDKRFACNQQTTSEVRTSNSMKRSAAWNLFPCEMSLHRIRPTEQPGNSSTCVHFAPSVLASTKNEANSCNTSSWNISSWLRTSTQSPISRGKP